MKEFLLMCCILMGMTALSHAQGGGMRMSPEERAQQLQTQLKLNDDQTAKVAAIFKVQAAKRDSIMTSASGDHDAMRQAVMPLMKETNEKIKTILTAEQAAEYDKMVQERMQRLRQGGGGN